MTGPTTLRTQKALLTRYSKSLRRLLDQYEPEFLDGSPSTSRGMESAEQTQTAKTQIEEATNLVQTALTSLTSMIDDSLTTLDEQQRNQIDDYIDSTLETLERAQWMLIQLDARLKAIKELEPSRRDSLSREATPSETRVATLQVARPELPTIPIPVFSGNVLEFTNFWTLFRANVHDQPLTGLQKFNYLLNALRGEARDAVRRYMVTEENYNHAVKLLQTKYGDTSKLIDALQSRLEEARSFSSDIKSQRRLLEHIIPIVTQLEQLGVNLNGSYMSKRILAKFSTALQRHIFSKRLPQGSEESNWRIQDVLNDVDQYVTMEESINDIVGPKTRNGPLKEINEGSRFNSTPRDARQNQAEPSNAIKLKTSKLTNPPCIYCSSYTHKTASCTQYTTISQRRKVLQERGLCTNCSRKGHQVKDCMSSGCLLCNGARHHHSICPQRVTTTYGQRQQPQQPKVMDTTRPQEGIRKGKPKEGKPKQTLAIHTCLSDTNVVADQQNAVQDTVLHHSTDAGIDNTGQVLLLTGCARVWNEVTKSWTNIEILFDTGADQSFISETLVGQLGLKCPAPRKLKVQTFGNKQASVMTSKVTTLAIWDQHGQQHPVTLLTTPTLTGIGKTVHLTPDDYTFIKRHDITLSKPSHQEPSTPQVLLGCDQLWYFLDTTLSQHTLPSGLKLIPSKLGYLLSGRQHGAGEQEGLDARSSKGNPYTPEASESLRSRPDETMCRSRPDITVFTYTTYPEFEDELSRWDKYWTMDSAGVCEFTGTKDAEKKAINDKVNRFFNNTIERRDDGYYVRLPYKEDHDPLPTNKAIAIKRLNSTLAMLRSHPDVLQQYKETIESQLDMGIIETIPNNYPAQGQLHYIPHQAVITPHKETTKLRIVFDASSHFKNAPSLNDVLHQGPTILPELYAVLLRFRMSPFVAVSDVEKAFLQVRLHESDRDATRFLWVRDPDKPAEDSNLTTLRFTRVTFGLNVSPFLLAGTINYHLRTQVHNKQLAEEIRENLYVDNLVLAGNTVLEIRNKSLESRQIFNEMNMNLREFLSNDHDLHRELPEEACAKNSSVKILGVKWNARNDNLSIQCSFPSDQTLTKRIVARRIASVYDPHGWLVPLLTPAKRFQQLLWKQRFEWDMKLPSQFQNEWKTIADDIHGFNRSFPRHFPTQMHEYNLAVFTDASDIAMCACVYVFTQHDSTLMMAKCKLPSIQSKTTMPKLEMNALTLGTRLVHSAFQAVKPRVPQSLKRIFVFSDSQIALSWLNAPLYNSQLGRLVDNRLKEIRSIVQTLRAEEVTIEFRYVATSENPADAGTRGLTKEQLQDHAWWTGPKFLLQPWNTWTSPKYAVNENSLQIFDGDQLGDPKTARILDSELDKTFRRSENNRTITRTTELMDPPEGDQLRDPLQIVDAQVNPTQLQHQSKITTLATTTENRMRHPQPQATQLLDLTRYSTLLRAKRVTVKILVFVKKLLRSLPTDRYNAIVEKVKILQEVPDDPTTVNGALIRVARIALIRNHQALYLTPVYRKSMENSLRPFQDKDGVWRSKGRFGKSSLTQDAQCPIFIAPNTPLATLIINDAHGIYHQGIEHTMATVRAQYWIPKLRQQVRKLVQRCVKCRRFNALPYPYPETTDLPQRRVQRGRTFQHIGLDFFDLPSSSGSDDTSRTYGCIFICTTTRMVHLEMLNSMNTVDFINALRRFIARRGVPDTITCDNAPTFLLTSRILSDGTTAESLDSGILDAISAKEIQWTHITPYAPWQGGFYERLIKSVKHALYKALRGAHHRSGDHLNTILVEIEATLNSRPLTYQGETQEEFSSLRPIDFLQKDIELTLPLDNALSTPSDESYYVSAVEKRTLQTRQQVMEALRSSSSITERFWTIWQQQYLTALREKHKKTLTNRRQGTETPAVGDIVLVSEPVLPRNEWRMAKIVDMRTGTDGQIREVELITSNKRRIRRPVNLLIPLEIQDANDISRDNEDTNTATTVPPDQEGQTHQYNLRPPSKRLRSRRLTAWTVQTRTSGQITRKWFLFHVMPGCYSSATDSSDKYFL